jgi:hypothetical protein
MKWLRFTRCCGQTLSRISDDRFGIVNCPCGSHLAVGNQARFSSADSVPGR